MKGLFKFIRDYALFGIIFIGTKGLAFIIPILLADILPTNDFGMLEWSLGSVAMIISAFISLGVPGAYPYFILKRKELNLKSGFVIHPISLVLVFIVNQFIYFIFNIPFVYYLAVNIAFVLANQLYYSSVLKSKELILKAVLFDTGIYLVLTVYFLAAKINLVSVSLQTVNSLIVGYAIIYVIYAIYVIIKTKNGQIFQKYLEIIKFSYHLLISSTLIFLVIVSGRILVEHFFDDYTLVGVYGYYYRISAAVVMIYQIIYIVYFKKIYTIDSLILDKYYSFFFIFIFIFSVVLFMVSPLILPHISNFFSETYQEHKGVYFILSVQMVMWIAISLNSSIIDRENLASINNKYFIVLLISIGLLFYLLRDILVFKLLVFLHFSTIYLAVILQYFNLRKRNILFINSSIIISLFYFITTVIFFVYLF
ncbi:hypothetical protein AWE51_22310 [Aquimarina aggregata]|uniref:Polysaccharide biosynthesis protein C-terminal domain-containing protein n=1 Tax=Aquimarina aggregata TaxID=1642818 RepID=A0A162CUY5_9FLAO|nr:hypothetical protein [Aquimarina aggregata]KZS41439.1 hypothetical protein AWE51_22310 [Aquimarina aggregata]